MTYFAVIASSSVYDLLVSLGQVFYFIVLPMLLLSGIGYINQLKLKLDMRTLTKLNFNLVVPGIIYASVVTSKITAGEVGRVILFALSMIVVMAMLTFFVARLRKIPPDIRNVMMMTTVFQNSGNYAIPLQDLAFRASGMSATAASLQAFYMIVQNVCNFTFGVVMAASGRKDRHWRQNLMQIAKFPPIYALIAAIVTIQIRTMIGNSAESVGDALLPFWKTIDYIRNAFVTIALFTLGAQLALIRRDSYRYPIRTGVILRLLLAPMIGLGLIYLFNFSGLLAQVMLISTSTPTAVNVLLLCMEFDNHPGYAARAVLYSTIISPVTVTLVVFLSQGHFLSQLETPKQGVDSAKGTVMNRQTVISIEGQKFRINGRPTYAGRTHKGIKIEGLLMNSRMVQGIFEDLNSETRARWNYPDGPWDPDRNTNEFVDAMPIWRDNGLLSFTINLQGGNPEGYSKDQPWHNSAFAADGSLRPEYMARLERILDKTDELGMAPIVGFFYFGQDERLIDEAAVKVATENATHWITSHGYRNVLIEIANETNVKRYEHAILRTERIHELVHLVQEQSAGKVDSPAGRLLVSVSMGGGAIPPETIVASADFLLLHGNGVKDPNRIREMVNQTRAVPAFRGQPIVFNEDDHFDFHALENNMLAAVSSYASWGYFDYRMKGEGYDEGYQSVPVNWGISSDRKRGFFSLLSRITGKSG